MGDLRSARRRRPVHNPPRRKTFAEAIDAGEERIRVLEQVYPDTPIGQKWARAMLRPQRTAAPVEEEEEDYSDEYRRGHAAAMRKFREVLWERTAEWKAAIASRDFKGSELTRAYAAEAELTRFNGDLWRCRLLPAKAATAAKDVNDE